MPDSNSESWLKVMRTSRAVQRMTEDDRDMGFCFVATCPAPLRSTPNPDHWAKEMTDAVRAFHAVSARAFPGITFPLNLSMLPCGRDCIRLGLSRHEHRVHRGIVFAASLIALLACIFSLVVFAFNFKRLSKHLIHRSLIILNIASAVTVFIYLPASIAGFDNVACFSDGTLTTHQPGTHPGCGFVAVVTYFFGIVAIGYFVVLTLAWQQLVEVLDKPKLPKSSVTTWWSTNRVDVVSAAIIGAIAFIFTLTASLLQAFDGNPLHGICTLSESRKYYSKFLTFEQLGAAAVAAIFLSIGIYKLLKTFGVRGALYWVGGQDEYARRLSASRRGEDPCTNPNPIKRRRLRELSVLTRQILFYLVVAILSFIASLAHALYVNAMAPDWKEQGLAHIRCVITSCYPQRCPPLPTLSLAAFILTDVMNKITIVLLASWAFSRRLVANVPYLGDWVNWRSESSNSSDDHTPLPVSHQESRRRRAHTLPIASSTNRNSQHLAPIKMSELSSCRSESPCQSGQHLVPVKTSSSGSPCSISPNTSVQHFLSTKTSPLNSSRSESPNLSNEVQSSSDVHVLSATTTL